LYGVNFAEGFNLRREVFIRVALTVQSMKDRWMIVLPPWSALRHWSNTNNGRLTALNWRSLFDLDKLRDGVHVMEYEEYVTKFGHRVDYAVSLQRNPLSVEQMNDPVVTTAPSTIYSVVTPCDNSDYQLKVEKNTDSTRELYPTVITTPEYGALRAKHFECARAFAYPSQIARYLQALPCKSLLVGRYEMVHWGPEYFGAARTGIIRKMAFAPPLIDIGNRFIQEHFSDALGKRVPYLSVHFRRTDFVYAHRETVPTLAVAATQIRRLATEKGLHRIFIASDMMDKEFEELHGLLDFVHFQRTREPSALHDAHVAAIEQWIAANGEFFIGTEHSSYSNTIRHEMSNLGKVQQVADLRTD